MYCEECFDDMEKNGYVKKVKHRMLCPMCMDDGLCVTHCSLSDFSSTQTNNYYLQRGRKLRQSQDSGLKDTQK